MKYLAILFGACLVGLSGCVIETTGGGGGGAGGGGVGGGTGGNTSMGGSTGGSTGGSGGATGGTGGTGGSACMTCGDFITNGSDPAMLCTDNGPPSSSDLYGALGDCTCAGACADKCTDSVCAGMTISDACLSCVQDTAAGCGNEFNECANDI